MQKSTFTFEKLIEAVSSFRQKGQEDSMGFPQLMKEFIVDSFREEPKKFVKTGCVSGEELFKTYSTRQEIVAHNNKEHLFEGFQHLIDQLTANKEKQFNIWSVKFKDARYFLFFLSNSNELPVAILKRNYIEESNNKILKISGLRSKDDVKSKLSELGIENVHIFDGDKFQISKIRRGKYVRKRVSKKSTRKASADKKQVN